MAKQLENIQEEQFGKFEGNDLQGMASVRGGANQTSTTCEKTIETCSDKDSNGENNDLAFAIME
jgi:hypothetical protein